jgi:hypothetical protein
MCCARRSKEANNESMDYRLLSTATKINLLSKVAIIVSRSLRVGCFCSIWTKSEFTWYVFVKLCNKKLQDNPSPNSQVFLCVRSDGQSKGRTDIRKLRIALRIFRTVNQFLYFVFSTFLKTSVEDIKQESQ